MGDIVSEVGFTFERGNADELAHHLKRLLQDSVLRENIGKKSRQIAVEKYDWKRMGEEYYLLFNRVWGNN